MILRDLNQNISTNQNYFHKKFVFFFKENKKNYFP